MKTRLFILLTFCFSFVGCSQSISPENPEWVENLIVQFKKEPEGNPPQSIWRYNYKGKIVYYVPPQCCDQFSTLYDENGNELGAPDGGMTGNGDGRFPDFFTVRTDEKLIWQDLRQR